MNLQRYDRQMRFAPIGREGQERLCGATVLILGVGALGSVVAELLARAGVGRLRLADRDVVELSNLQRQALYTEADASSGLSKVDAAAGHLAAINSEIHVEPHACDVTPANILTLFHGVDLVVDGTDNFETRYLLNDAALETQTPWVHGGCVGASGQVYSFWPGRTICFRCLVPQPPAAGVTETCDTAGVIAPATHLIAAMQATAALRLLVEREHALDARLQAVDIWRGRWHQIDTGDISVASCPACQEQRRDFLHGAEAAREPIVLCGRNAVQIPPPTQATKLDLDKLAARWQSVGEVQQQRFLVRLAVDDGAHQITVFRDGRTLIEGTEDIAQAKTIRARWLGS